MNKKVTINVLSIIILALVTIFNPHYLNSSNITWATEDYHYSEYSSNITISKEMSRTELIEYYSKENNVNLHDAELALFNKISQSNTSYKYRILSKKINDNTHIEFYISESNKTEQPSIERILVLSIKNPKFSFSGNVYVNLENNTTIYYDLEGSFLKESSSLISGNIDINVGESKLLNLGTVNNSNTYEHISTSGYINLANKNEHYNYKTLIKPLKNNSYLEIYVKGDGWRNYFSIEEILHVSVKNSDLGYSGNIYVNLEDNFHIHFDVEGVLEKNVLKEPLFFENTPTTKNFIIQESSVSIDNSDIHISDSGTITP